MNETEVRGGIIAGVRLALRRADLWSDGRAWPGDTGAENLLQVSIAEKVYAAGKTISPVIELEPTLSRLGVEGDQRRVDVALMRHADDGEWPHPFCVIEVKKAPGAFAEDLHKIETLFATSETLRYAFLATYFQQREGENGRARTAYSVMEDLDEKVCLAADAYRMTCRSVEAKLLGRPLIDDYSGDTYRAGAVIHRFGPPA